MEEAVNTGAKSITKRRFWELDFLRGLFVILMVIDHTLFSIGYVLPEVCAWCEKDFLVGLQEFAQAYWVNMARNIAQMIVSSLFFVLCGISCTLSKSNLKRGLIAAGVAMLITVGTYAVRSLTDMVIYFGVIHMLASSMLIYYALSLAGKLIKKIGDKIIEKNGEKLGEKKCKRIKTAFEQMGALFPAFVGLVLLIIYFAVPLGHVGIKSGRGNVEFLPDVTVNGSNALKNFWSIFVELKNFTFNSDDYFPLLPHMPLVLLGSGIGQLVYNSRHKYYLSRLDGAWNRPITAIGRKALIVYVLHQIFVVALLYGIGALFILFR